MKFKFENLAVWNMAMDLADSIQTVIKAYPIDERFNLIDQTLRSVDSIALNIGKDQSAKPMLSKGDLLDTQ